MKKPYKSIGQMRTRIEFYKLEIESDGQGNSETIAKKPFATSWGMLRKKTGGRGLEYGQMVNQSAYELVTRYMGSLDNSVLISIKGKYYTIDDVVNVDELNRYQVVDLNVRDGYDTNNKC